MSIIKEHFWEWFDYNKKEFESFLDSEARDYNVYEQLSEKLAQYSELLIPELTGNEKRQYVLVISCDGIRDGIPYVEELVDHATPIDNWVVQKFRQPGDMKSIPVSGLNLKKRKIYLTWNKDLSGKYELTFYVRGYSKRDSRYRSAIILHLDHAIGELNAMTKVVKVQFRRLGLFQSGKPFKTLDDLYNEINSQPD